MFQQETGAISDGLRKAFLKKAKLVDFLGFFTLIVLSLSSL